MLPQHFWEAWRRTLDGRFVLPPNHEWTVEANPETITPELAHALVSAGVNRVSLGVQSFTADSLQTLERRHRPESVPQAVNWLREAGIGRLSLDLIFGVPGQDLDAVTHDISEALAFEPDHLSVYGLIYEPNTALTKRRDLGLVQPCEQEFEAAAYEMVVLCLQAAGLQRYEVSNFARPGEECRHNLKYWQNEPWWALGPSSSGQFLGLVGKTSLDLRAIWRPPAGVLWKASKYARRTCTGLNGSCWGFDCRRGSAFTNLPASTLDPGRHEKPRFDRWSIAACCVLGPNGCR